MPAFFATRHVRSAFTQISVATCHDHQYGDRQPCRRGGRLSLDRNPYPSWRWHARGSCHDLGMADNSSPIVADRSGRGPRRSGEGAGRRRSCGAEAHGRSGGTKEWIRQNGLIYGALIGIGVVMVRPFSSRCLSSTRRRRYASSRSRSLYPVLSALVLVTHQENFRQRASRSKLVEVGRNVGQLAAVIGVAAGFWHISWIAGVATIVAACSASRCTALVTPGWSWPTAQPSRLRDLAAIPAGWLDPPVVADREVDRDREGQVHQPRAGDYAEQAEARGRQCCTPIVAKNSLK